jgi:hypothetical protein
MAKSQLKTVDLGGEGANWTVYPIGSELAYASRGEIEQMFKGVGTSQFPIHAFQVDRTGAGAPQAVAVYLIPNDPLAGSAAE